MLEVFTAWAACKTSEKALKKHTEWSGNQFKHKLLVYSNITNIALKPVRFSWDICDGAERPEHPGVTPW